MPLFGDITYNTQALGPSVNNASLETWVLTNRNLVLGTNVIAVEVHQAELPSSDIVFGLALNATRTFTNFPSVPIVLNEVLANNATVVHSGETNITDWVELHNLSTNVVDLSDMSLTDNAATPRRWAVPAGVSIPPGGYLLVRFDSTLPISTNNVGVLNTGFGLSAGGDEIYLYDKLSRGGGIARFPGVRHSGARLVGWANSKRRRHLVLESGDPWVRQRAGIAW
jgi:hypothetical protein